MAEGKDFDVFDALNPPTQTDQDLAALLFAETAPPPQDATQTTLGEEALAPTETVEVEEAPKKPGLLARLKGLFRRKAPEAEAEETAPEETPAEKPGILQRLAALFRRPRPEAIEEAPPQEAGEAEETATEEEARPRSHKKILLIALAALALLGAGIGGTVLIMQRMEAAKQAEWQKKEAELAAEKAQLETQKAELAALKARNEKQAQEAATPKAPDQAESGAAAPGTGTSPTSAEAGDVDCAVVGKETAAQTIKRCIEAYNRATGRTQ